MVHSEAEGARFKGSLNFKYPQERDISWKSADTWLRDKRNDDGAEGLWRVHDNLFDVTNYINKHPGGPMWLELTKGTDITEAFECHHLSTTPQEILQKYFVKAANTPRNSPFTFENDGFYCTLKRRIIPVLKDIPQHASRVSNMTIDLLFLGIFVFALLATIFQSYIIGCISGILLCITTVAAHNYLHRRDNFRMYYFNISLMHFREWRITHALSHHLYPNTVIDFEVSSIEPFLQYLPKQKSLMAKYGSWILAVMLWVNIFPLALIYRVIQVVFLKEMVQLHWSNLIPFVLPAVMYLQGGQSFVATIGMWLYIMSIGSLLFGFLGFNAAHHHPEIFHDGDLPRSRDKIDWGVFQLDAVAERYDVTGSPFLVLTAFGDHALHHLFPTLDHGCLQYLYEVFHEVMNEFGLTLRMKSQLQLVKGQFMQLAREKPNMHLL